MADRKYQRLRAELCAAYGARCFGNKCPLRHYQCYTLTKWDVITPIIRKRMEKVIDSEVERLGLSEKRDSDERL